jgi:hypothetical protein
LLEDLRKPFFIAALILALLTVLVELGSIGAVASVSSAAAQLGAPTPGEGIPSMAMLDGLLFYAVLMMGIAQLIGAHIEGKIAGIITLIVSVLLLLAAIVMVFKEIALLILMVSLLLAIPFGTIAYFAAWDSFNTGGAAIALSILMFLKLAFAACLVLAQQGFLKMKGLMLIILTSLLANLVVSFLQGLVPGFLVSITDDIAGIVVCILAIIWLIVYLIGSVISIVKTII